MAAPSVAGLDCPNCGAAITVRALQQTQTVVCPTCHAVLDSRDQQLSILQAYQAKLTFAPDIPLGTRGTLRGNAYEVSGFQVRSARQDDTEYFWREYTLWNPFIGYRYLMEDDGHWTDFAVTRIAPSELVTGRQPYVTFDGGLFRHFRTTTVTTEFLLGEFPWQVLSGDRVTVRDFVAPPCMLSEEVSPHATVWVLGHDVPASVIWHAFSLAGAPPPAKGTAPCDPNPYGAFVGQRAWAGVIAALPVVAALLLRSVFTAPHSLWRSAWPYALLLVPCVLPAAVAAVRASRFERARWATSDYAPDDT